MVTEKTVKIIENFNSITVCRAVVNAYSKYIFTILCCSTFYQIPLLTALNS